jgi:hypothetical protein
LFKSSPRVTTKTFLAVADKNIAAWPAEVYDSVEFLRNGVRSYRPTAILFSANEIIVRSASSQELLPR